MNQLWTVDHINQMVYIYMYYLNMKILVTPGRVELPTPP